MGKKITEKEDGAKDTERQLLEQLAEERKKREEAENIIADRDAKELKERDPMSGLGKLCECTKITLSEAWQLPKHVINTPDGRQEMRSDKCPEGYQVRKGANGNYIVGLEDKNPDNCAYIPNCRSKYTQEYEYKMKKPAHFKLDQEPPVGKVHLCEKHAKVLLGK